MILIQNTVRTSPSSTSSSLSIPKSQLQILQESEYIFHLTGSRFFCPTAPLLHPDPRDYHFFATYSKELKTYLESIGFVNPKNTFYNDSSLVYLMRYTQGPDIDIQLVHNAALKLEAQRLITASSFPLYSLTNSTDKGTAKQQHVTVWNAFLAAARVTLEERRLRGLPHPELDCKQFLGFPQSEVSSGNSLPYHDPSACMGGMSDSDGNCTFCHKPIHHVPTL